MSTHCISAEMNLDEVRRLYFRLKNDVFTGGAYNFDTKTLEKMLQEIFPPHMRMDCVREPKCVFYLSVMKIVLFISNENLQ